MTGLRTKLWFGVGGLLGILLIVSAMCVLVLTHFGRTIEQLYRENYDSIRYCDAMKRSLDQLNSAAIHALDGSAALQDESNAEKSFVGNLNLEIGNTTLPGEAQCAGALANEWRHYLAAWGEMDNKGANRLQLFHSQILPSYDRLKELTQQISDMNMNNIMAVDGQVKQSLVAVRFAVMVLVLAGTVLASAFVMGVGAAVLRSVRSLTNSAREIECGNLDLAVEVNSRDEIGQLAGAFNSMADKLREFRKSDHERLLRAQQTTQLAIDSLPDAVCVISPAGEIEISNRTAEQHFGIVPRGNISELKLPWLTDLWKRVVTERHSFETEGYRNAIQLFDNQEERFLLPRAMPMLSSTGELIGITVILVDVTRLRHADELKSGLLSTVSHELRTPLTSIRMGVLMLSEEKLGPLTVNQRRSLAAVREDSDRLHRIIENLLSMGRIEAGGNRFQARRMTANEVVEPAIEMIRSAAAEKDICITAKIDHHLPEFLADPSCLEVALGNLLGNAVKFTPRGGKVGISVRGEGGSVIFEVRDTGRGIPAEHAHRIFERFYRVVQKDGPTGAGLGLAISREIVQAHGGRIWFTSDGGGSVFSFSMPVVGDDRQNDAGTASCLVGGAGGETV